MAQCFRLGHSFFVGGLSYETCCVGDFGVGNPFCFPPGGRWAYSDCCAAPSFDASPPLTFSHLPLRLGSPPWSAGQPLSDRELSWATAGNIHEYMGSRASLANNVDSLRRFRSRDGMKAWPQHYNPIPSCASTPWWQERNMWEAMAKHDGGQAILSSRLHTIFDAIGDPEKTRIPLTLFPTSSGDLVSCEYLVTVQTLLAVLDAVRVPEYLGSAQVAGQAVDGREQGLPRAPDLARRPVLPWNVIEVGAGWGFLALLTQLVLRVRSYSVVDLWAAQAVQYHVLEPVRSTTAFLSTNLTSEEVLPRYDLFISNFAFGELDPKVRKHYFQKLILRSRRGFIADNSHAMSRRKNRGVEATDSGEFAGLDLVRRLRGMGFAVKIQTLEQLFNMPVAEPVGVTMCISWTNLSISERFGEGMYEHLMTDHAWKVAEMLYVPLDWGVTTLAGIRSGVDYYATPDGMQYV